MPDDHKRMTSHFLKISSITIAYFKVQLTIGNDCKNHTIFLDAFRMASTSKSPKR